MIVVASYYERAKWRNGSVVLNVALGQMWFERDRPIPRVECLQPYWEIVQGVKSGRISSDQYRDRYRELMRKRWPAVKAWLQSLDPAQEYTLLCFCREGSFCHRQLVAEMIKRHRPELVVEVR